MYHSFVKIARAEFLGYQGIIVKMKCMIRYVLCAGAASKANRETQMTYVSTCKAGILGTITAWTLTIAYEHWDPTKKENECHCQCCPTAIIIPPFQVYASHLYEKALLQDVDLSLELAFPHNFSARW